MISNNSQSLGWVQLWTNATHKPFRKNIYCAIIKPAIKLSSYLVEQVIYNYRRFLLQSIQTMNNYWRLTQLIEVEKKLTFRLTLYILRRRKMQKKIIAKHQAMMHGKNVNQIIVSEANLDFYFNSQNKTTFDYSTNFKADEENTLTLWQFQSCNLWYPIKKVMNICYSLNDYRFAIICEAWWKYMTWNADQCIIPLTYCWST